MVSAGQPQPPPGARGQAAWAGRKVWAWGKSKEHSTSEERGSEGGPEQPRSWHRGDNHTWDITVCHSARRILHSDCRPPAVSPTGSQLREGGARDLQLLQLAPVLSFHSPLPSRPLFPGFGLLGCVPMSSLSPPCGLHIRVGLPGIASGVAACLDTLPVLWLFQLLPDLLCPHSAPTHQSTRLAGHVPQGFPRFHMMGGGSGSTRRYGKVQGTLVRNREPLRS